MLAFKDVYVEEVGQGIVAESAEYREEAYQDKWALEWRSIG
jgi:hypothetical protein